LIHPTDRRIAKRLIGWGIWRTEVHMRHEQVLQPSRWRGRWLFERMLKRMDRDHRHHAPGCLANHYHYRKLVFHRCDCGALHSEAAS
jgi:hypothetical protein